MNSEERALHRMRTPASASHRQQRSGPFRWARNALRDAQLKCGALHGARAPRVRGNLRHRLFFSRAPALLLHYCCARGENVCLSHCPGTAPAQDAGRIHSSWRACFPGAATSGALDERHGEAPGVGGAALVVRRPAGGAQGVASPPARARAQQGGRTDAVRRTRCSRCGSGTSAPPA